MIKAAIVSNFFNHHLSCVSEALYRRKDTVFHFIEAMPMDAERKNMGWKLDDRPPYVLYAYESDEARRQCMEIINEADFVIVASDMPLDSYMAQRHRENRLIFRYSERFYKNGCPSWQIPMRFVKNYWRFGRFSQEYLLCSSAFTAADAAKTRSFIGKAFRWGYFPETRSYDTDQLFAAKRTNEAVSILWAGRYLDWKHPDDAVAAAAYLKERGIPFRLRFIGTGAMEQTLRDMIREKDLGDCVEMLGSMKPGEVRAHMEQAQIYLFTSDYGEGWGAVLNESMNSGCAVVASHAIGAAPYLIRDGENGFLYHSGDVAQLCEITARLAKDPALREKAGRAAYDTIVNEWNAEAAADRLVALYEDLRAGGGGKIFREGPCSPAPILPNEWYRKA